MMLKSMSKILLIRSLADIGKTHSSAKSKVDEMDLIVIWENFGKLFILTILEYCKKFHGAQLHMLV